jgi:hypothetical protein
MPCPVVPMARHGTEQSPAGSMRRSLTLQILTDFQHGLRLRIGRWARGEQWNYEHACSLGVDVSRLWKGSPS